MAFLTSRHLPTSVAVLALLGAGCGDDDDSSLPVCDETTVSYEVRVINPDEDRDKDIPVAATYEPVASEAGESKFQFRTTAGEVFVVTIGLPVESPFVPGAAYNIDFVGAGSACYYGGEGSQLLVTDMNGELLMTFTIGNGGPIATISDTVVATCTSERSHSEVESGLLDFSHSGGPAGLAPGSSVEQGRFHYYAVSASQSCAVAGMVLAEWARP